MTAKRVNSYADQYLAQAHKISEREAYLRESIFIV